MRAVTVSRLMLASVMALLKGLTFIIMTACR